MLSPYGVGGFFLSPASACGVSWWVNSSASPSPYLDLTAVIRALRGAVGGWGGRGLLSIALVLLLYGRLGRICGQMERLAQRFQAGRLWRLGARKAAAAGVAAEGRSVAVGSVKWPGRFGWLVRAVAYQAAGYGCQLRVILGTPEMVELLIAAPQAARILRPLCRMLAVETSLLRPRVAGEVAPEAQAPGEVVVCEPVPVVAKRVRRARPPVDWGRIPLPRGVLSAARRQGFGKVPRD
jgi:hypothetical protein